MRAVEIGGAESLAELEDRWDHLVARSPEPAPFLRAGWLRAWWSAFGEGDSRLVAVFDGAGRLAGGALFEDRAATFQGVPVRMLSLAANVHSNRADLVAEAERTEEVAGALAEWAHSLPRWTVLRVDETPNDGVAAGPFVRALARLGHRVGTRIAARPPWIRLDGGLPAYEATLSAKWRSNLRNREKRMAAIATVEHERFHDEGPLDECLALEAKAWKGATGSAIQSSPRTERFYRDVARLAAEDGSLALHTLRLGGRLAAFQLDLEHGQVEYVLKIGYEPAFAALSPGALLLRRVIASAAARGVAKVDLLGDDMPWKRDWTGEVREHHRVFAFADGAAGRGLHALEFFALPFARRMRDRWLGAR